MGCCARKANTWTTAIMVYTIVQSICSAIWQIFQIMLYENFVHTSLTGNALLDAIQAVYYFHVKNSSFEWNSDESRRVNILAIAHLAADVFWIFISIIALSVKSKKSSAYCVNILWMCTAVGEVIIDVTSVALFAKDAITWQDQNFGDILSDFIAGAILMAIVASRFILLLLVNVCMFFGMMSITKALKKPPTGSGQHRQQHHQQQVHGAPRHSQHHRIVPLKPAMRTPRPPHLQQQDLSRVNNWYHHYDDALNVPRNPKDERLRENLQDTPRSPQNLPFRGHNSPVSPQNLPFRGHNSAVSPQNTPQANPVEVTRPDQDPSNWYNVYDDMQPAHLPRVRGDRRPHHHQLAEEDEDLDLEDDAPSEFSYNDNQNFVGDHTNVMVNGVPSGTLRRQLPWSYVHEPGMFPRKQTRDLNVEAPPVPVPDYTMRYHRNQRLELDSWSHPSSSPGFPHRSSQMQ